MSGSGSTAEIFTLANLPGVAAAIGRSRAAESYRTGRLIYSDFSNTTLDAAQFTLVGFSHVTDASIPAIQNTAAGTLATLRTTENFKDFDVRIKYREVNDGTFGPTRAPQAFGRDVPGLGNWIFANHQASAGVNFSGVSATNGLNVSYVQDPAPSDVTNYRYFRLRVTGNVARAKTWVVGQAEPDWAVQFPIDNDYATGSLMPWYGACGILSQYNTCYVSEFKAIELLRSDENLLFNAQLEQAWTRDSTGVLTVGAPWAWANSDAASVFTVESLADRYGVVRPALKVVKAAGSGSSGMWTQQVVNALSDAPNGGARQMHSLASPLSGVVEVSVWSKAQNVVSPSVPVLGAAAVLYQFDVNNAVVQYGNDYYSALSPGAKVGGLTVQQNAGQGGWDWTETRFRALIMPGCHHAILFLGLHDGATTGTVWVQDPVIRAIV